MELPRHIFREYDVRGIVGKDLNAEIAELVGRAFASQVRDRANTASVRVAVGRDNRPSSPSLRDGLVRGLRAAGAGVVDVGEVPTPTLYWSEATLGVDAGCQVTGSHNPSKWNGIKLVYGGDSLYGKSIGDLRRRIVERDLRSGFGSLEEVETLDSYVEDLSGRFQLARPVKLVVDAGNGVGSLVAERLLTAIGAEVAPLHCEPDGTFPNHHPDPTVDENLQDLISLVRSGDFELGVGFDGDADRLGAVDEHGGIVRGDVLLLLFGLDALRARGPGRKLVFDVKCSRILPEVFSAHGGVPVMWKTGHSLIKRKMKECGASLAGELSGHFILADGYRPFDDAPFAACRLASIVSRAPEPLSAIVSRFPKYVSTREVRAAVPEADKWRIVEEVSTLLASRYEVNTIDGVRADAGYGWALVRASNTQPAVTVRCEARTREQLSELSAEVEDALARAGVEVALS
ncbi:MAG: phosphomannomutase/phosphoglucomutase [Gemmatimonadetes bacterium]|nr:phosphomannomutase/phosphoglucomutase [Gemmatimonadota bacterium]